MQFHGLIWHGFRGRDSRLDRKPQTLFQDVVQLMALVIYKWLRSQARELRTNRQQRGDTGRNIVRFEAGNGIIRKLADLSATRNAAPGEVDAIHQVIGGGFTREQDKAL